MEPTSNVRREIQRLLMQSSINPEPVPYWGSSSNLLSLIFNGRAVYFEDTNDKKTKVRFVCENHVAVVSDPGII